MYRQSVLLPPTGGNVPRHAIAIQVDGNKRKAICTQTLFGSTKASTCATKILSVATKFFSVGTIEFPVSTKPCLVGTKPFPVCTKTFPVCTKTFPEPLWHFGAPF